MNAVLLISHGSRSRKTKEEVALLADDLKKRAGIAVFEYAFLEIESPSIPQGIDSCVAKGATRVIILLNFLNSGRHVDQDIPAIVEEAARQYPCVRFSITGPVGQHPKIAELFLDLIPPSFPL
ncbi:MAG: CbiX/SirB N-terminal domain-containing protein [Candidatus Omnitrophica bacterium]|nr:CbiX/SirB N-terminal domain-containing protein [Candidatus Omnitrophota bacterium]